MDILEGRTSAEIARNLEIAIRQGQIEAGEQLPPVREVADRLGVNRNTVTSAYSRLRDAGLIIGAGRQGSRVALIPSESVSHPLDVRDLASGNVDPQFLPRLDAYLGHLAHAPGGYEMADDEERLVSFGRSRFVADGLPATEIAVISGSIDAIERALRARLSPESAVAVEDPGYVSVLHLLRAMEFPIIALQMDEDGVRPDSLSDAVKKGACAVVLTPRAQNPSGRRMTADRAAELGQILDVNPGVLLLEDDHAGEVSGALPVSSAPSDPEKRPWMTIRSVSKFLGPDLRLALAAGDSVTIARVRDQQALGPRWVSHILQRLAYEMWSAPETTALMRAAARSYEARRQSLIEQLASNGIEAFGSSGLHVWVPVEREGDVVQAMLSRGWSIQAGEVFRIKSKPAVRIGVANLVESECPAVASALADSLKRSRRLYT
ncbi:MULTISPECIES: aminotransferase class I/II-fold pyridoxal phosphate-dependent enzyme [unclassified Aureimonas]|uniref:aminotransferase class I/II-fold pyridoxal phosphate-dependent enzyme n=1 Tax=unclassified Aureimonas TaxID=2615206 RepID=UPI0009E8CC16|nr:MULTISPECIES: aminotransferase class I/II-fold pyridoxal phosphate-dependent enzyme [unclassified Aureimonas]